MGAARAGGHTARHAGAAGGGDSPPIAAATGHAGAAGVRRRGRRTPTAAATVGARCRLGAREVNVINLQNSCRGFSCQDGPVRNTLCNTETNHAYGTTS